MRVYGIGPWDMDRLTSRELSSIARDLKAMNKGAKG